MMRLWPHPSSAGAASVLGWWQARRWRGGWRVLHPRRDRHDPHAWQDRLLGPVSFRWGLNDVQREHLAELLHRLQQQRDALLGPHGRDDLQQLMKDSHFDRWLAEDLLRQRLQALRDQGPALIDAMARLFDSLAPHQQQRLRQQLQRWAG